MATDTGKPALTFVSDCCGKPATVADGDAPGTGWPPRPGTHYICRGCEKACDIVPDVDADWDPGSQRWFPW